MWTLLPGCTFFVPRAVVSWLRCLPSRTQRNPHPHASLCRQDRPAQGSRLPFSCLPRSPIYRTLSLTHTQTETHREQSRCKRTRTLPAFSELRHPMHRSRPRRVPETAPAGAKPVAPQQYYAVSQSIQRWYEKECTSVPADVESSTQIQLSDAQSVPLATPNYALAEAAGQSRRRPSSPPTKPAAPSARQRSPTSVAITPADDGALQKAYDAMLKRVLQDVN